MIKGRKQADAAQGADASAAAASDGATSRHTTEHDAAKPAAAASAGAMSTGSSADATRELSSEPSAKRPRFTVRPVVAPVTSHDRPAAQADRTRSGADASTDPFIRPEAEDDDGYDPFSDRPPTPEPLFERDPWA